MNSINKQNILEAIRQTAENNGGAPLGRERFEKETGIKPYDWGKHWAKFSDAQKEAGLSPNVLNFAYENDFLLEKIVEIIREIGRYPTRADLLVKRNADQNFPSPNTIARLGGKETVAAKLSEYAIKKQYKDIIVLCDKIKNSVRKNNEDNISTSLDIGEVYLFKSGQYYKIGKTNDTVRRGNEIRIQLPEKMEMIHSIKTDDPSGIETYWHKRFESKRMKGEWFGLNSSDIRAFKLWKRIA